MDDSIFGKKLYRVVGPTRICYNVQVFNIWKRRYDLLGDDPQAYISHNEWFYTTNRISGVIGISHPIIYGANIDYKNLSFLICNKDKAHIVGAHTLTCSESKELSKDDYGEWYLSDISMYSDISGYIVITNDIILLTAHGISDIEKARRREKLCLLISKKYGLGRLWFYCYDRWATTKKNLKEQLAIRKKQLYKYQDKVIVGGIDKFREANWIMYEKAQIPEIEDGNLVKVQVSIQYKGDKKYLAVSTGTSIVYIPYNAIELLGSKVTYLPRGFETEIPVKALEYLKKNPDYIRTQIADIPIYKWAVSRLLFWINAAKQTRKM
jgi:hypothetical protein